MQNKHALARFTIQQIELVDKASKEVVQTRSQFMCKASVDRAKKILGET